MNKKIFYISYLENWGEGISKKMEKQIQFFKEEGYVVKYISLEKDINKLKKYILRIMPFCSEFDYKKLDNAIENLYIRYGKLDFLGYKMLKKMRKKCRCIIIEIPTYPYDNELKGIDKIFSYKDKIWRKKIHKYVDYIVTYSNDKEIYGVKCINISNFGDITISQKEKKTNIDTNIINLLAVASLSFWHGYDRIIEGLYLYYLNFTEEKKFVKFHLVGDGRELEKYKKMVKKYGLENYVIFYGNKKGKELDEIYNLADIAIDTLGRHRSNVYYNSTLKGKEYLIKGLPIVSGVVTELDNDKNFKYYLKVEATDSPIEIKQIVNFFENIYLNQNIEEVSKIIREYGLMNFNVKNCMMPVISVLDKYNNERK